MIPSGPRRFWRAHADLRAPAHLPWFSTRHCIDVYGEPRNIEDEKIQGRSALEDQLPFEERVALYGIEQPKQVGNLFEHIQPETRRFIFSGADSRRDDGIQPATHPNNPPGLLVVRQSCARQGSNNPPETFLCRLRPYSDVRQAELTSAAISRALRCPDLHPFEALVAQTTMAPSNPEKPFEGSSDFV